MKPNREKSSALPGLIIVQGVAGIQSGERLTVKACAVSVANAAMATKGRLSLLYMDISCYLTEMTVPLGSTSATQKSPIPHTGSSDSSVNVPVETI